MKATDEQGRTIELTKIAGDCNFGDCPAVSLTDRGTASVQGYVLHVTGTPDGENVVEVPVEIILEAARALC